MHRRTLLGAAAATLTLALARGGQAADDDAHRAVFWRTGDVGQRLHIRGRVVDAAGKPVAGASVSIWQADGTGVYQSDRYRGEIVSGADGGWFLITALPGQYSGNKHIHLAVYHPSHPAVQTEILFKGDNMTADPSETIALEEAQVNGEKVLLGRFVVTLGG